MKRMFPSLCLAAAFAVGLSAQTPTQTPPQQPSPQTPTTSPGASSMAGQKNNITLTGCVKAGSEPNSYVLSNIKADGNQAGATAGTAGTAGAAAMPDLKGQELKLTGASASSDLSKHVGHTVRVTGMLTPQSGMNPRGTAGTPSTTTPSTTPPSSTQPSTPPSTTQPSNPASARPAGDMDHGTRSFNVSSVTMVSATCEM